MSASFPTIIYEKSRGVAHLSLNRPQQLNAYSIAMRDDFAQALRAVAEDSEVGSLLITGQGRAFCAGADLNEFGAAPSQVIARNVRWQRDVWGQLIDLPKPIVAAVHGYCIGSGLEIALLADVRIAAEDTVFSMPEVRLGMIPAAGGSQTLFQHGGPSRALDLLLTGRRFGALEAMRMGLISRTAPAQELLGRAWDLAARLAEIPYGLLAAMRAALRHGADMPITEALQHERRLAATLNLDRQPETG
ncbi:MAG: enoyl-CoA hydratase/isomerase family protein [Chloroflexota bacterium]|nr:enoyl-CoA hydratase/isomerase family protein [Chloroflexota bacterium]MDE2683229.1 enoyl-CoA hydratase/isomerase family protein [Chloroflexota bacterium]